MSDIVPLKQLNDVYAREALDQLPRLLSMIDRNAYSQTFGCGDRMFWLDKAIDFPSSIYQYGVHALALVYTYSYVNNPFYRQPKIRDWAFAMMRYWQKIQNKDGSFDEFYPNEHGWAGPTGFLLHAMMGSFELLSDEMDPEFKKSFLATCRNAAIFLSTYDEHGILANHHAMALLPIYHYSHVTGDRTVLSNFGAKLDFFLSLQSKEGWYLEYDGADMGYLSASISFMSKLSHFMTGIEVDKAWKEKIDSSIEKAIEFAKYFVYPNGYYGGTMGSRQTLHFYPHGFEQWAGKNPVAARMAEFMRMGLEKGSLVSPRIMPGRYLAYRINEFLVSSIDCHNVRSTVKLPWEEKPFTRFFPEAGIWIRNGPHFYALINFSKGGVIKVFSKPSG
ncbi:MAG: hypothetical protein U1C71_01945, partial [archaeon]|nr:hypothetical protein [archaeon]